LGEVEQGVPLSTTSRKVVQGVILSTARSMDVQEVTLSPGFRIRIDLMRIRIQHFFLIADPDPESRIRIPDPGFDGQKLQKIYSWKFNFYFLDQKLQFTYP
jgi:hypothetical protein